MSLRRKMTVQIAAMLVGLLLVSAAALWGLNGLRQEYGVALASYHELREVYGMSGARLLAAQELLRANPDDRARAAEQVENAQQRFDLFLASLPNKPEESPRDEQAEGLLRGKLAAAAAQLRVPRGAAQSEPDLQRADMKAVEDAMMAMATFTTRVRQTIQERRDRADEKRRTTILAVSVICGSVVAGAMLLGVLQYRSVVVPVRRLMKGARTVAAGQFQERVEERGSEEFIAVAGEFNRMAAELNEFYHRLEQRVADTSKELIRSERLASVGYLAAGVAHEINNPLGIIAGYAEYSLDQLKRQTPSARQDGADEVEKSLRVICDEAFRCKEIIGKLLSLTRPGEANRSAVDLGKVAADVVATVGGLRDFRDRKLTVAAAGDADLTVSAVEGEMKQVVLNLTLNALDAIGPGGHVRIDVARTDGSVELSVRDDGRGMTAQTLERVFEPFFTEKRGSRQPGTGLGLSITHAIVESHGGRIRATSPGPGQGSAFVVQLPAAAPAQRSVA